MIPSGLMKKKLRVLVTNIKKIRLSNDHYTQAVIMVGVPATLYFYFDWRAALAGFVVTQSLLGVLREMGNGSD